MKSLCNLGRSLRQHLGLLIVVVGVSLCAPHLAYAIHANALALGVQRQKLLNLQGLSFDTPAAFCSVMQPAFGEQTIKSCWTGRECYLQGLENLARGDWRRAAGSFASSSDILSTYYQGWASWCSDSPAVALQSWRRYGADVAPYFVYFGQHFIVRNDPQSAVSWFTLADSVQPGSVEILTDLGDAEMQVADYAKASEAYSSAIATGAAGASAYGGAAIAAANLGHFSEAAPLIESAIRKAPANWVYQQVYGGVLLHTAEWVSAEKAFRAVVALDPTNGVAYVGLATALAEQGRLPDACIMMLDGLGYTVDTSQKASYAAAFADTVSQVGSIQETIALYLQALDRNPSNADVILSLAAVYGQAGQCDNAKKMVARLQSLAINPGLQILHPSSACPK